MEHSDIDAINQAYLSRGNKSKVVTESTDNTKKETVDNRVSTEKCTKKHKSKRVAEKKSRKCRRRTINNSTKRTTMSENKSTFDRLFESYMNEGEEEEFNELGIDIDDSEFEDSEFGDSESEEVTITLKQDQISVLRDILSQVDGEGEDPEDLDDYNDEFESDDEMDEESRKPFEEENQPTNQGKRPGQDPSNGGGQTSEVAPDSLGGKSSGTGDPNATDEQGTKTTSDGKRTGRDPSGMTKPGNKHVTNSHK